MIAIEITEEFSSYEQAAENLERIAKLLRKGYTSGTGPAWDSSGQEDVTCSADDCDVTQGVESTYCGSYCPEHLKKHLKDCEVCRNHGHW